MWTSRMYRYPAEEVFRFHFKSPRDISPRRDDVHIPKPTYYTYRNRQSNQPTVRQGVSNRPAPDYGTQHKSERAEYEFMQTKGITTKDAPFGTLDTPTITMKVIGGEQKPVIEKHPKYNEDYLGSRLQPLDPIPNPPQRSDPREYDDMPGGVYSNAKDDMFEFGYNEPYEPQYEAPRSAPTALISKRPDSKDLSRSQFKALPRVQALRKRNDTSTVFEKESWAVDDNQPLEKVTEYKQNFRPDLNTETMEYQNPTPLERLYVSDAEKHSVMMLVPRNVLLPSEPIVLPKEKERILCKLICIDLEGFDERKLRDIYMDASLRDPELNGYCDIQYLDSVLRERGAYISADTLRVLAAQFVNPQPGKLNKVNYEKILSFVGSALDLNRKGQLSDLPTQASPQPASKAEAEPRDRANDGKPKYYQDVADLAKTGSLYKDREVAKLLRMVEQELSKSTYVMDWTKWYDAFNAKDREHRETLSAAQIKDICYDLKLPLSASLQNQILTHCEDSNGDGQYYWHSFLDFLSRVRPSNTGLPIPVSKRPLEYAKHYPAPVPNWPRAEGGLHEPRPSPRKDQSPQRNDYYERNGPSPRREPSPRRPIDDREKFASDRKRIHEQQPIFREKSPPVPYEELNGSPEIDLQPEFDRHADREGRHSRLYDEGRNSRFYNEKPSGYKPSWQDRQSRLDEIPQKDLDPRFRDHNYRTYPPQRAVYPQQRERPRSFAEPTRPDEPGVFEEPYQRNRSTSPVRYQSPTPLPPIRYPSPPPGVRFQSPPPQPRHLSPSKRRRYTRYGDRGRERPPEYRRDPYGRDDGPPPRALNREEQIKNLSDQLRQLETKYQITKDAISTNQKPWLDRYLKMANALYNSDISNRGCLPKREVLEIVKQYNSAFNLNLDDYRIGELITDPNNLDRSGNVLLQPFLSKLSA